MLGGESEASIGDTADSRLIDWAARRFGVLVAVAVAAQGVLWIAAPLALEGSVRLDVAEGAIDGPEWQLSYFRHPPLSSWLSGLAWHAGAFRYAAVYAIGWALASGAFAIAALFLRRVGGPRAGLVTLVVGLTSPFATYVPIQVNHNITLMAFWAVALAAAWAAFESGGLPRWALFGAVVGSSLWAKYSILHLIAPLAALFFVTPTWRRAVREPGPWLAGAICAAVAAPHFVDAAAKGFTTLRFAGDIETVSLLARLGWIGEFVGDCVAVNVVPAAVAAWTCGPLRLAAAARAMTALRAPRLDRFLVVAAVGPILVVVVAALFGRRPHYLWITAFTVSFAVFWGRAASLAAAADAARFEFRRLALAYVVLEALGVVGYAGVAVLGADVGRRPRYPDMDGPALAAMAEAAWSAHESGPIPYLVSYGGDRIWPAMQAAGSIAFDLPYRTHTLVEADPSMSSWIDVADLERRGALVVSVKPLRVGERLIGVKLTDVVERRRPMRRGSKSEPIYFAILPPGP